jgi:hypothetical protein
MKRIIAIFSVIFSSLSASDMSVQNPVENNQFGYLNFGIGPLPFPVPMLGGGYRIQSKQHGIDLNASAVIVAPERLATKFSGRYLHYFTQKQQWYMGIGPQVTQNFDLDMKWRGMGTSPEILLGRESYSKGKNNKRFWELVVDYPLFFSDPDIYKWDPAERNIFPYVFIQYGWGF